MNANTPNADALRLAYPGCPNTVAIHERADMEDGIWKAARRWGLPPEEVVRRLVSCAEEAVRLFPDGPLSAGVIAEMRHPDFLSYVKSKLGAL